MTLFSFLPSFSRKLPVIVQSEVAECGITCLSMIANYHGLKTSLMAMRQQFPTGSQGITVRQIINIANEIGFSARVLKIDLEQLSKINKPAILHWNFDHFVVLSKVTSKGITIHDPARGVVSLNWYEVSDAFTGVAIELLPTSRFTKAEQTPGISWKQVISNATGYWSSVSKVFAITVIFQVFILLVPYYLQLAIDRGVAEKELDAIWWGFWGFMFIGLLAACAQALRGLAILYLNKSLVFQLKAGIHKHLVSLPLNYFESRRTSDIKARFDAIDDVQQFLTRDAILGGHYVLLILAALGVIFWYQPIMAMVSVSLLMVMSFMHLMMMQIGSRQLDDSREKQHKEHLYFHETLAQIRSVKSFGREQHRVSAWLNIFAESINAGIKQEKIKVSQDAIQRFLSTTEILILMLVGSQLVIAESLSLGGLFAILAYRQLMSEGTKELIQCFARYRKADNQLNRLADIVLTPAETRSETSPVTIEQYSISVSQLCFRYSKHANWLLNGLNFTVQQGESVALVGRTGIGKTTLLKLMAGLLTPEEGQVFIDRYPLSQMPADQKRHVLATVLQHDCLLRGTIAENIAFFDSSPDMERIKEVAKGVTIWDEIKALPMGLHTQVGDPCTVLSGGQIQRILLARAVYRSPSILLLDEATSFLDLATEQHIDSWLRSQRITRIFVSHCEETVQRADRIINLSELSTSSDIIPLF